MCETIHSSCTTLIKSWGFFVDCICHLICLFMDTRWALLLNTFVFRGCLKIEQCWLRAAPLVLSLKEKTTKCIYNVYISQIPRDICWHCRTSALILNTHTQKQAVMVNMTIQLLELHHHPHSLHPSPPLCLTLLLFCILFMFRRLSQTFVEKKLPETSFCRSFF